MKNLGYWTPQALNKMPSESSKVLCGCNRFNPIKHLLACSDVHREVAPRELDLHSSWKPEREAEEAEEEEEEEDCNDDDDGDGDDNDDDDDDNNEDKDKDKDKDKDRAVKRKQLV